VNALFICTTKRAGEAREKEWSLNVRSLRRRDAAKG
jgi:hypothetical protein